MCIVLSAVLEDQGFFRTHIVLWKDEAEAPAEGSEGAEDSQQACWN